MTAKGVICKGEWVRPLPGETTYQLEKRLQVEQYDSLPKLNSLNNDSVYNLYVLMGCPFAHSARIAFNLKGFEENQKYGITYLAVNSSDEIQGLCFDETHPDNIFHKSALWELYVLNGEKYTMRATVPLLFDVTNKKPALNSSMDIMKLLDSAGTAGPKLFLQDEKFNEMLDKIIKEINIGAYGAVFATTQAEYDRAVNTYFGAMDYFEELLSKSRYLWSNTSLTACDIRLFVTLLRFDLVYHHLFDLNKKTLKEFPNLYNFTKEIYQMPKIKSTINQEEIRRHYYRDFMMKNTGRLIPVGPGTNFDEPHDREKFTKH